MSRWTPEQLTLLRELAGKKCAREIAAAFGRTRFATLKKMACIGVVGLPAGRQAQITKDQLAALRAVKPGISARQFATNHGLSGECVRHWARKLGVKFVAADDWTATDCAQLQALAGAATAAQAAAKLGRSAKAVRHKAAQLGVALLAGNRPAKEKPAKLRPTPIALAPDRSGSSKKVISSASRPERPRVETSALEWCRECHSPVSNWQEHYERMGHRKRA